jgi:putative ABC transport system permease protein
VMSAFALIALALCAGGIYSIISFTTTQRTREIGVRMALGARPGDIARLVVGRAFALTAIGAAIGGAGAFLLTRFMESLLYDTTPTEPTVFAAVVAGVIAVTLAASLIPGRAAAHVDPLVALRAE